MRSPLSVAAWLGCTWNNDHVPSTSKPARRPQPSSAHGRSKPSKRDAILDAMLEVVAERGFHDAPMSIIAERAGASAGVIYHHFASKEEIIQALYQRLSELKRRQILEGYTPAMDPRDAFVQIALNAYRFYRQHQRELRFLEQFELAGFPCPPPTVEEQEQISDFEHRFVPRSRGGVLNELPDDVYRELTMGVILRLAKLPQELPESTLQELAQKVWEVVRAAD